MIASLCRMFNIASSASRKLGYRFNHYMRYSLCYICRVDRMQPPIQYNAQPRSWSSEQPFSFHSENKPRLLQYVFSRSAKRALRRMAASMSGVELSRELDPNPAPMSLTTSRRPSSLTTSISLPAECIVLTVAPGPMEPSPERKLRRVESTRSFLKKDGRAIHPKPFRIY